MNQYEGFNNMISRKAEKTEKARIRNMHARNRKIHAKIEFVFEGETVDSVETTKRRVPFETEVLKQRNRQYTHELADYEIRVTYKP